MKKLIIVIVLLLAGYHYYKDNTVTYQPSDRILVNDINDGNNADEDLNFTCDGREYCSQMTSYEEAVFFIKNCPNTKMDGDGDGIPCERQFKK